MTNRRIAWAAVFTMFGLAAGSAMAQAGNTQVPVAQTAPVPDAARPAPAPSTPADPPKPKSAVELLIEEVAALKQELTAVRSTLARRELELNETKRQLTELEQFIADHREYGDDFSKYRSVKVIAEQEARDREVEAARAQREAEKNERAAKRREARAARDAQRAEAERVAAYRRSGFAPIGLDVYTGKMAFHYDTRDGSGTRTRIDYDPLLGSYLRPIYTGSELDYTSMTISGSIVNGAPTVRNIGVAITFFDDNGNQVGSETIQIENARPDVPYPFTSDVKMALNRAFESSSTYVLYADEVDDTTD